MRTSLDIKKQSPDLLLALHIFGVKQVYLDVSENFEVRRSLFKSSDEMKNQSQDDRFERIIDSFSSISTEDSVKTSLRDNVNSFSHKNISEAGDYDSKNNKEYEHMFRDNFSLLSDNNTRVQDELKSMKNYRIFDPREDAGYFVVFEHINEAAELLFKKVNHSVIAEVLGDKMQKMPCFIGYEEL